MLGAAIAIILILAVEGTVIATVLPTIVGNLGGFAYLSWAFTAYRLTQADTIPIYGRFADLFERKRVLLREIGLFLIRPLIDVFLISHTIWPMVFWVNLPIGGIARVALMLTLREQLEYRRQRIDYFDSALMMLSTRTLMFALVDAAKLRLAVFFALVSGAVLPLGLFVLHERRTPEPMLPLWL